MPPRLAAANNTVCDLKYDNHILKFFGIFFLFPKPCKTEESKVVYSKKGTVL